MNSSENNKEVKTPEKRNSLSLNDSDSYIQLRDGSYKKIRNKNYKEIYFDKMNYSSSLNKRKYDNNSNNFSNKSYTDILNKEGNLTNLKFITPYDENEQKRKKNISFADNVNFHQNKNNSNIINNNKNNIKYS